MGFFKRLFGGSHPPGTTVVVRNKAELERCVSILVYWPSVWREVRAGKSIDPASLGNPLLLQMKALLTLSSVTKFLDGETNEHEIDEDARFVVGGLRDIFIACEGKHRLLSDSLETIDGLPSKIIVALLLALIEKPSQTMSVKLKDARIAKQTLLGYDG